MFSPLRAGLLAGLLAATILLSAQESAAPQDAKELGQRGMPPRATPGDYQVQGKAGNVTIGAEFMGHAVPTPESTFESDDYVVVEVGLFGSAGTHTTLARGDFSLRINGKKSALPSEPLELVYHSLKDPQWQPPVDPDAKSSKGGGLTTGDGGGGDKVPPLPPKMPFELRRAMNLKVDRTRMEEGERPLPQAGLLFFSYRGKREGIRSLELIYSGAAGSATLDLAP
jgi:hypothetical protein